MNVLVNKQFFHGTNIGTVVLIPYILVHDVVIQYQIRDVWTVVQGIHHIMMIYK